MQNIRPMCPTRPGDESVADRIEALLARCDGVRRGSALRPVVFNEQGERHANEVARRDAAYVAECLTTSVSH